MTKQVPRLTSDSEAEAFLDQDLSGLDFGQFKPVQFEFEAKSERVNMRLPASLLAAVKASAAHEGIPYQRLIRQILEQAVGSAQKAAGGRVERSNSPGR